MERKVSVNETLGTVYDIDSEYKLLHVSNKYVDEVTLFVASTYYFSKEYTFTESFDDIYESLQNADAILDKSSETFVLINNQDEICCTAKILKKMDCQCRLPIEKEFGFNLNYFDENHIYEFARFASNGNISFSIIKKMLLKMMQLVPIEEMRTFASIDKEVCRKLIRLGFPLYELGTSKFYIGTETVHIGINIRELKSMMLGVGK